MYDQVQAGIAGSERRAAPRLGRSFVALAICFALAAVAACVRIPRPAPTVNDAITTRAQGTGLAKAFGIIVYRQGDFARAASLLKESSRVSHPDAESLYYIGMAQSKLNQRAESKQTLQNALDLHLKENLAAEARQTLAGLK